MPAVRLTDGLDLRQGRFRVGIRKMFSLFKCPDIGGAAQVVTILRGVQKVSVRGVAYFRGHRVSTGCYSRALSPLMIQRFCAMGDGEAKASKPGNGANAAHNA